ncbi:hypothetical protein NFI96_015457 [Prochilodus magdalenae]|nr:hypothetical protein NFI96_015457 [Prochilodus magdalenae]
MISSVVPVDNARTGFTIVTHMVPSGKELYGVSGEGQAKEPLKGEPKALGTVQIMIGILTLLLGIVLVIYVEAVSVFSGVTFWGSFSYIASGALSVVSINQPHPCVVKGSLVMNVFSALSSGLAMILLSHDLYGPIDYPRCYDKFSDGSTSLCSASVMFLGQSRGISGVLLVFSVLEFIISICTSVFACKATYSDDLMVQSLISNLELNNPGGEHA